jgi:hypothetical protein
VAGPSTAEAVARLPATTAAEDVRARLVQASSDPIDLDALVRLRLAVSRLGRRIRQRGGSGVTPSQLSVLFSVARLQPVSLGELAAVEDVQPPSITRCVATLSLFISISHFLLPLSFSNKQHQRRKTRNNKDVRIINRL